jgi:AmmeMemoRadiSam system protein A
MDVAGLGSSAALGETELCGQAAVRAVLEYARLSGATALNVLNYTTSAEASGDPARVVGYSAHAIYPKGGGPATPSGALTQEQRTKLLKLARAAVEAHVAGKDLPDAPKEGLFGENRAVFVTIHKKDQLRGCIGQLLAQEPLAEAVRGMAVEAASRDPRFGPVTAQELGDLTYEVSVLSEPEKVPGAEAVVIGRHGVILRRGPRSGVFLPKVAETFDFDKEAFLSELCSQKAGLERDCWRDPDTEILVFTAEEFAEP